MTNKSIVAFLLSITFFALLSFYSYKIYTNSKTKLLIERKTYSRQIEKKELLLNNDMIKNIVKDRPFSDFLALSKRNIFKKGFKKIKKERKPVVIKLPKIKIQPKAVKAVEIEPIEEDNYYYRGQVILGGRVAYVIVRDSDLKTFFVHTGDKLKDFIVLDTNNKRVVISDYNENIKILKKILKTDSDSEI